MVVLMVEMKEILMDELMVVSMAGWMAERLVASKVDALVAGMVVHLDELWDDVKVDSKVDCLVLLKVVAMDEWLVVQMDK